MAPSTPTPSNLRRTSNACRGCRAAKVRCVVSQQSDQCDRCISNNAQCMFIQPNRSRTRRTERAPNTHGLRRDVLAANHRSQSQLQQEPQPQPPSQPQPLPQLHSHSHSHSHSQWRLQPYQSRVIDPASSFAAVSGWTGVENDQYRAPITAEIRTRMLAALSSLKGKRGSPFSFVTSGEMPSFSTEDGEPHSDIQQARSNPTTLKLSGILRPLNASVQETHHDNYDQTSVWVSMPSYLSSLTLGHIATDPIRGGMLTQLDSVALFQHFMLEMNAKWEYILDPLVDTHDDIRRRSPLLFTTVLFCSSKFVLPSSGMLLSGADPVLQGRLCSLARNLAVRAFAAGDRSLDTLQAFYLLVCWKDPDDDVSYLHSGYAYHILQDMDLEHRGKDDQLRLKCRRTWLALFRQDKQQKMFFIRNSSTSLPEDDGSSFTSRLDTWLTMSHALPLDSIACCSADLRRIQSRLRAMIQNASPAMLPCLLDLLKTDLTKWKLYWAPSLLEQETVQPHEAEPSDDPGLLRPNSVHLKAVLGLWESSVKLNVASAVFRQGLTAKMTTQRSNVRPSSTFLGAPEAEESISTAVPGLRTSVDGAFGTLRHLLQIPAHDLRRSPDSVLLLGPNASLFLCLLMCLPCEGILGISFQNTAIGLIRDVALHVRSSIQSPQDVVNLHADHLDSIVKLLPSPRIDMPVEVSEAPHLPQVSAATNTTQYEDGVLEAAQVLAGGLGEDCHGFENLGSFENSSLHPGAGGPSSHVQSLADLLDIDLLLGLSDQTTPMQTDIRQNNRMI